MCVKWLGVLLLTVLPALAAAEESALKRLDTGDDGRGWEAVGRINFGTRSFCTGTLIAPQLVLTAAHCLFDKDTGRLALPEEIEFLAGWRNGRAAAYRGVRRAVAHPKYSESPEKSVDRVAYDVALIELDQPIRLISIKPFAIEGQPRTGQQVGVVSYGKDRSDAPSLQEVCHVLGHQAEVLALSCSVEFGSSGSPIFTLEDGTPHIVSIISAKAEMNGEPVALGTALEAPLADLRQILDRGLTAVAKGATTLRNLTGGGAKFIKP